LLRRDLRSALREARCFVLPCGNAGCSERFARTTRASKSWRFVISNWLRDLRCVRGGLRFEIFARRGRLALALLYTLSIRRQAIDDEV
jgi:hypothetical protein